MLLLEPIFIYSNKFKLNFAEIYFHFGKVKICAARQKSLRIVFIDVDKFLRIEIISIGIAKKKIKSHHRHNHNINIGLILKLLHENTDKKLTCIWT